MTTRRTFLSAAPAVLLRSEQARRLNVLMIVIDDLRPQLGCYGDTQVKTPHIDRLAGSGLLFERAYCQQALCGPSRSSFLTGRRPESTGVYDITTHFRKALPDAVTLPQLFKNSGYVSRGFYKVFHLAGFDPAVGNLDDPASWTAPLWLPRKSVYGPEGKARLERSYAELRAAGKPIGYGNLPRSFATEAPDVDDDQLSDGEMAGAVMEAMGAAAGKPFFLAAGFYKPHLPYVAPKKYWDLYRESELRLPGNRFAPRGAPEFALQNTNELREYVDIPKTGPIDDALGRRLLRGYLASISYVDAQVGRLLGTLDRLRLRENTVVVLMGDNGYQVGEHNMWGSKHTNFETSVRVPLMIAVPGGRGARTRAVVELLDLYPTLADLCGLRAPKELEGTSLRPLFDAPARSWKRVARSQYPRGGRMGRSVRTDRYRYTEWNLPGKPADVRELYDHETDPEENQNLAAGVMPHPAATEMAQILRREWKGAQAQ